MTHLEAGARPTRRDIGRRCLATTRDVGEPRAQLDLLRSVHSVFIPIIVALDEVNMSA